MKTDKFLDKPSILKSATDALELLVKYRSAIEPRLKPDEIGLLSEQVHELSGKKETFKRELTRTMEDAAGELHACVKCIRNLVRNNDAPDEILKAYGADESITDIVPDVITAARKIIRAYDLYTGWSRNEAGILKEDMDEINQMIQELSGEKETFGLIQKNKEEDLLEDVTKEIARISALGVLVYKKKDPAIATVFEKLIPSGSEHEMAETEFTG